MIKIHIELDGGNGENSVFRNSEELTIIGNALLKLAKPVDQPAPDLSAIPSSLKPQNPIESEVKQGTSLDPEIPAVDADNYPWDKRIHSTVHTRNTNGTWKLLKRPKSFGTDVEAWHKFIEEVRAELRGETSEISETQETGEQTTDVNPADVFGNESENPAAGVDSNTVVEQTTTIVNTDPPKDFPALMKFITSNGDKITIPNVGDICTNFNLPDVTALMKPEHADLIPLVYNSILEVIANGVPNES